MWCQLVRYPVVTIGGVDINSLPALIIFEYPTSARSLSVTPGAIACSDALIPFTVIRPASRMYSSSVADLIFRTLSTSPDASTKEALGTARTQFLYQAGNRAPARHLYSQPLTSQAPGFEHPCHLRRYQIAFVPCKADHILHPTPTGLPLVFRTTPSPRPVPRPPESREPSGWRSKTV